MWRRRERRDAQNLRGIRRNMVDGDWVGLGRRRRDEDGEEMGVTRYDQEGDILRVRLLGYTGHRGCFQDLEFNRHVLSCLKCLCCG